MPDSIDDPAELNGTIEDDKELEIDDPSGGPDDGDGCIPDEVADEGECTMEDDSAGGPDEIAWDSAADDIDGTVDMDAEAA